MAMINEHLKQKAVNRGKTAAESEFHLVVKSELGKGQFGSVFLALDEAGVKHAVKVSMKPVEMQKLFLRTYLERELAIHQEITHRNVVKLYHCLSLADCTVLDMEFCDMTLTSYIKNHALNEAEFRGLVKQLTCGINALHSMGVVHRDIKPDNIMLVFNPDKTYIAKFADLGFAKKERDRLKTALGSPLFEAPEVLLSENRMPYTNRCDMWSLGVVYYFVLSGSYPFPAATVDEIIRSVCLADYVAFELPERVQVSECCRHFVRSHLLKDSGLRISSEQAYHHPYIMPVVHVMQMATEVKSEDCLNIMKYDVEFGDIVYKRCKAGMNDAVTCRHLVEEVGISDESVQNDMIVFFSNGVCAKKDDPVDIGDGESDLLALVVSSKGLKKEIVKAVEEKGVSVSDWENTQSLGINTVDCINKRLELFSEYIKCCRHYLNRYDAIVSNCKDIETFLAVVLKPDFLHKKLRDLQHELCKKCPGFPNVALYLPACAKCQQLADIAEGRVEIDIIRSQIKEVQKQASQQYRTGNKDMTVFNKRLSEIWQEHAPLQSRCKSQLDDACNVMNSALDAFQVEIEVFVRLSRYVEVLEKASKESDPTVVYRDIYGLVQCDYLRVNERDMAVLQKAAGVETAAAKDYKEAYVETLNQQLQLLRESCDMLTKDRDWLIAQNADIASRMKKIFVDYKQQINYLRSVLKDHGIPDPTK